MKEHPILFSGPMVRALLAGTKTQTRRIVSYQKNGDGMPPIPDEAWIDPSYQKPQLGNVPCLKVPYGHGDDRVVYRHFPKWEIAEKLWVREAFEFKILGTRSVFLRYKTDLDVMIEIALTSREWDRVRKWKRPAKGKWRGMPGMFMVRSMSRLTLEITGIRVERLNKISKKDAITEGCNFKHGKWSAGPLWHDQKTAVDAYCVLWDSINAKRGFGWSTKPWVWALTFKRIEP